MEVVESEPFRGTALAVEEINRAGGVLGREIEPVCHDPGSDPAAYRTLADRLMIEAGVGTIFGCLTSACRKAILPSLERRNGLLWYAANYEGFEYSPNIIYTGAAPNQSTLQLASYILRERGNRIALIGSNYVFPRETNRIIRDLVEQEGGDVVAETYVPIAPGAADLRRAIGQLRGARPEVIVCTIIGRGVRDFYRACSRGRLRLARHSDRQPVACGNRARNDRTVPLRRPFLLGGLFLQSRHVGQPDREPRVIDSKTYHSGTAVTAPASVLPRI
jgi:branched-chain amino acid transport system substrate-binding protein